MVLDCVAVRDGVGVLEVVGDDVGLIDELIDGVMVLLIDGVQDGDGDNV